MNLRVRFKNNTGGNVDLIWKDYGGQEVAIRHDIPPGDKHIAGTFLKHSFIARDCETRQVKSFSFMSITSVVFEGLEFGLIPDIEVEVSICES